MRAMFIISFLATTSLVFTFVHSFELSNIFKTLLQTKLTRERKQFQPVSKTMRQHLTHLENKLKVEKKRLQLVSRKKYQIRIRKKMRRQKYQKMSRSQKMKRNQEWYKEKKKFKVWSKKVKKVHSKIKKNPKCTCGVSAEQTTKIVNGIEVPINKYPWMAAIVTDKRPYWTHGDYKFCGGSIINDKYVLTAGHCINAYPDGTTYVILGDHDIKEEDDTRYSLRIKVAEEILHSRYDDYELSRDVGLLKLDENINFSLYGGTILPICLPEVPLKYYGQSGVVAGWGKNWDGQDANVTLNYLNEFNTNILWMDQCRNEYGYKAKWVTGTMLCAIAFDKTQGDCQGDSGGPLFLQYSYPGRYEQIGVVSWGIGCADPKYPGVYAKLSHHLIWIAKNTKDATYCSGE